MNLRCGIGGFGLIVRVDSTPKANMDASASLGISFDLHDCGNIIQFTYREGWWNQADLCWRSEVADLGDLVEKDLKSKLSGSEAYYTNDLV